MKAEIVTIIEPKSCVPAAGANTFATTLGKPKTAARRPQKSESRLIWRALIFSLLLGRLSSHAMKAPDSLEKQTRTAPNPSGENSNYAAPQKDTAVTAEPAPPTFNVCQMIGFKNHQARFVAADLVEAVMSSLFFGPVDTRTNWPL